MKILYADDQPFAGGEPSIFLAGPTPRSDDVKSWRPEAVQILDELGFKGTVLIPERKSGWAKATYVDQIGWELAGLEHCTRICFWVPREMATMPALTTNIEFGYWIAKSPERVVYGRPETALHCGYLDYLFYRDTKRSVQQSLYTTLMSCVVKISKEVGDGD